MMLQVAWTQDISIVTPRVEASSKVEEDMLVCIPCLGGIFP